MEYDTNFYTGSLQYGYYISFGKISVRNYMPLNECFYPQENSYGYIF